MNNLRIFVDLVAPAHALELLSQGTRSHELVFARNPAASVLAKGEVDPQIAEAQIAFGQPDPQALAQAGKLRWVHISSSGITRYDTAAFRSLARQRGFALSNSANVYAEPCAVHALSFMLAQARQLPAGLRSRTASGTPEWDALRSESRTLRGETVLLVGYGAIARRLIELLRPFHLNLLAFRRQARGDEAVPLVAPDQLPPALGRADHVINILPESAETRGFFDAQKFGAMKAGSVFYNIGRGATVDQTALVEALRSGRLRSAWMDVTDPEPLPDDHPLWQQPNCFITPHTAGGHFAEARSLVRHFLANLDRFCRGEPLLDRVM
jgi:phosphoglycerate dehydrogenase-like enzyme